MRKSVSGEPVLIDGPFVEVVPVGADELPDRESVAPLVGVAHLHGLPDGSIPLVRLGPPLGQHGGRLEPGGAMAGEHTMRHLMTIHPREPLDVRRQLARPRPHAEPDHGMVADPQQRPAPPVDDPRGRPTQPFFEADDVTIHRLHELPSPLLGHRLGNHDDLPAGRPHRVSEPRLEVHQ